MSQRLAVLQEGIGPRHTPRNPALSPEAAELFGDFTKARFLIDRLQQRYLTAGEETA